MEKAMYLTMIERAKQAVEILTKAMEECEALANETQDDSSDVEVTVKLDKLDFALISQSAQAHGVSVSELLRNAALDRIEYEAALKNLPWCLTTLNPSFYLDKGAKIYYGVGSYDYDIIENNKEYLGKPIAVDDGVRVWAIAVKENYNNSSWTYQNMDYSQYEDLCAAVF